MLNPLASPTVVVDVTPSYEDLCSRFPDGYGSYSEPEYWAWLDTQTDVYFYERPACSFDRLEALELAAQNGYRKVILSNLS